MNAQAEMSLQLAIMNCDDFDMLLVVNVYVGDSYGISCAASSFETDEQC